ncbi:hypothetical protein B0T25DRAFT_266702 [Lasiosphaeria hispida]|uniref:Uncharacterized protein n=1 Tax=Lasiosphaeria hispida TaxID=260671 RepID=A0AAJ0HAE6_9PEZI|nr:hypothetical protein B0T25DRAFT_266702 [Lasiosphaeria hispida]
MCLALGVFSCVQSTAPDIFRIEVKKACLDWAAWPDLYQTLLKEGRIWDFRDLFRACIACFGADIASILFFGKSIQKTYRHKLIDEWTDNEDESTLLAQLDMSVCAAVSVCPSKTTQVTSKLDQNASQSLVQYISARYSSAMGTRPVMRWMLLKAFDTSFSGTDPFSYLEYCPGLVLARGSLRLPIYVPFEFEMPGWFPPDAPKDARAAVEVTLKQATKLQDYNTQASCLELLIMQTRNDPSDLFAQLCDLRKRVMGDNTRYLRTLLSSYLYVCGDRDAEMRLLSELKKIENWTESNALRDAELHLAKQQTERVLTAKRDSNRGHHTLAPLQRTSMIYYPWLSQNSLDFVEKLTKSSAPLPPPWILHLDGRSVAGTKRSRSRPKNSPPQMSGAVPTRTRTVEGHESDHGVHHWYHTSSDDGGDDDDDGIIGDLALVPGTKNLTLGTGRRIARKGTILPDGSGVEIEREFPVKREPGVGRPVEVESGSSDSDKAA